jgi:pimeloyl-ACP methyl ester carboxylesterase
LEKVNGGLISAEPTWRYSPTGRRGKILSFLLVFHGFRRKGADYRDRAIPLADQLRSLVVAPVFDKKRFPNWRYQRGGVSRKRDRKSWTCHLARKLAAWVRETEGNPALPYYLVGHSAGAQFLSRVAAFTKIEADRIVVANPSTYVRPRSDVKAPYGFRGISSRTRSENALRRYLKAPVTIFLSAKDFGNLNLSRRRQAQVQGATRYHRGLNVFDEARGTAQQHGWNFNWRFVVVPNVGHSSRIMLSLPEMLLAIPTQPVAKAEGSP